METEKELNEKILKISTLIQEKHPELTNYILEMQSTIPDVDSPEINIQNLKEYYESLTSLLENFEHEHSH